LVLYLLCARGCFGMPTRGCCDSNICAPIQSILPSYPNHDFAPTMDSAFPTQPPLHTHAYHLCRWWNCMQNWPPNRKHRSSPLQRRQNSDGCAKRSSKHRVPHFINPRTVISAPWILPSTLDPCLIDEKSAHRVPHFTNPRTFLFFDRNLHSRMPLRFTPLPCWKRGHACAQCHSPRVSTLLTGLHCKLRANTEKT
jgi:hypothetical protein